MKNAASPREKALLLAIPLVAMLIFGWLSGIEAYRWRLLQGATAERHAVVTETRRNPSRKAFGGPPFQIRYQFWPSPDGPAFNYTGQVLLSERWVRVPEHVWESAQSGSVVVRYSVRDPRINQPAAFMLPTWYQAAGFAAFSAFALVAALLAARDLRGRSNNSSKPTPLRGAA